ncbi:MAG: XRE family transcriptional regulator [Atopobiaceae bacterium]|nr:XRE family transcriptional regulator [Atopobiaceae bacterium]
MVDGWQAMRQGNKTLQEVLDATDIDDRPFAAWITDELAKRGLKKNVVVRRSRLNQTFAYQIMAGMRHPSRDKLIQLCFGMMLGEVEASELLERGGASALRPYDRRDVIVAFCLNRHLEVSACDDLLWGFGEETFTGMSGNVAR